MKRLLILLSCVFLTTVSMNAAKPKKIAFNEWDTYEVSIEKVGVEGTKFLKVWGFGKKIDDAIQNAKMNAVHACLFRGIPANQAAGCYIATPAICGSPDAAIANDAYFQDFFAQGGQYLSYVNLTTDGMPSGQDRRQVKGGYKVAIYVQVMYDSLKQKMQNDGLVKSLNSGF